MLKLSIKAYTVLMNVSFLKTGSVTTVDSCRNVSLKETYFNICPNFLKDVLVPIW